MLEATGALGANDAAQQVAPQVLHRLQAGPADATDIELRAVAELAEQTHLVVTNGEVNLLLAVEALQRRYQEAKGRVGLGAFGHQPVGELGAVEAAAQALEVPAKSRKSFDRFGLGDDIEVASFGEKVGAKRQGLDVAGHAAL